MTVDLSLSNIIDVQLVASQSGLSEPNMNSVALFSTETPSNIDPFRSYFTASEVATDYGSNSVTYQMANAIFGQAPNILSGGGQLVIIPLHSSVSATSGNIVTPDISANLTALKAISSGDLKVTVDGTLITLTGINLTNCVTLADVATILQVGLTNAIVSASSTQITFTSKKVGSASTVTLSATSGGAGTDLYGTGFLKGATSTPTAGSVASGETVNAAILRTYQLVDYRAVITNLEMEDAIVTSLATAMQARDMLFLHNFSSTADIAGVCTTIKAASNTHTRCLLYTPSKTAANLMKSAYAGRMLSTDFSGSNTALTANLKVLAGITPDSGINQTLKDLCDTAGVDIYVSSAGKPWVFSSSGNDYFDNIYNELWIKLATQVAGFNFLYQNSNKVPQTEIGMDALKAAYRKVCEQSIINDVAAAGLEWNSSDTFGNPVDFKRNITNFGFYIYSLPIAQQSQGDREDRIAPLVQIAIKLSGAIHKSNVIIKVQQ